MTKARIPFSKVRRRWRDAALLALVYGWWVAGSGWAQTPKESDVEAAYLFNFAKFMHTPVHTPDSFTICIVGKSPLSGTLGAITANEQIDGRRLKVISTATSDNARNCDIAFLSDSEGPRIDKDLAALAGSNVLTVSNAGGFLQHGGMIQFALMQNRVRFSVNLDAVNKEKITLSSELLKVAMSVNGTASGEVRP